MSAPLPICAARRASSSVPWGEFGNPEQLAYGLPAERKPLYRVRFTMAELWGDRAERPEDTLDAEIYAHWLEEVPDHAP